MKFLKTWAICIVLLFTFFFFGGWMLFDFNRHTYLAIAAIAFVLAVLIRVLMAMDDRIEALEAELKELKKQVLTSESEDTVS